MIKRAHDFWEKPQPITSSYKYQHSEAWALLTPGVWRASLNLQKKFPGAAKDIQLAWYEGRGYKS